MSRFELQYNETNTTGIWHMNRDEASTMWYALSAYKVQVDKQVKETEDKDSAGHGAGYYEELYFLHELLHKITKLMFELRDDHAPMEPINTAPSVNAPTTLEDIERGPEAWPVTLDLASNPVRRWLDTD